MKLHLVGRSHIRITAHVEDLHSSCLMIHTQRAFCNQLAPIVVAMFYSQLQQTWRFDVLGR